MCTKEKLDEAAGKLELTNDFMHAQGGYEAAGYEPVRNLPMQGEPESADSFLYDFTMGSEEHVKWLKGED